MAELRSRLHNMQVGKGFIAEEPATIRKRHLKEFIAEEIKTFRKLQPKVEEVIVAGCTIRLFRFPTDILEGYAITSGNRTKVVEECGFPILPLDSFFQLLRLGRFRQRL